MKTKSIIYSFMLAMVVGIFMSSCCQKSEKTSCCSESAKAECTAIPADVLKIVATLTLKDAAFQADFEKALKAVVDGTNTEEGNIAYEAHQDINNPLVYTLVEVWKSQEAINFHNGTEHFKAFFAAIEGMVDSRVNTMKKIF